MKAFSLVLFLFTAIIFTGCQPAAKEETQQAVAVQDSLPDSVYTYRLNYSEKAGLAGIYKVPSMLALCILDSAALDKMTDKVSEDYRTLQKELDEMKADYPGIAGQNVYAGDSANFTFECFQLLTRMPKTTPKKAKVVLLEAEQMLVYNHYGLYNQLPATYLWMLNYVKNHQLQQVGAFREIYLTDPTKEKDPKKWLTVVMLPVRK